MNYLKKINTPLKSFYKLSIEAEIVKKLFNSKVLHHNMGVYGNWGHPLVAARGSADSASFLPLVLNLISINCKEILYNSHIY